MVAVVASLLVGASPAAAAKWYCGSSCVGQNPQTYPSSNPCARDAVTVSTYAGYGRTLQLRYSNNCEMVWGRLYGGNSQDKVVFEQYVGITGYSAVAEWEYFAGNDEWSPMVQDHNVEIRACLQLEWATTPGSRLGCTGRY
jgi:hypothetical protein